MTDISARDGETRDHEQKGAAYLSFIVLLSQFEAMAKDGHEPGMRDVLRDRIRTLFLEQEKRAKRESVPPARDGETLSDERAILSDDQVELIREEARSTAAAEGFMLAHGSPTAHDILLLCDSHAALRAQLADARADTERLDWLDAEHERVDPVARLVVKRFHNRNGHQWADCAYSARREIDAARTAVSAPQGQEDSNG